MELLVGDRSQGRRVIGSAGDGDTTGAEAAGGCFSDDGIVTVDCSGAAEVGGGGGGGGRRGLLLLLLEVHGGGGEAYGG